MKEVEFDGKMIEAFDGKAHIVTIYVLDLDGLGPDGVEEELENTRYANHCMNPEVLNVKTVDVPFHDDHPLNSRAKCLTWLKEQFPSLAGWITSDY